MMDARNPEMLAERGAFYLSLARAFLTPLEPESFVALRDALADDLAEMDELLGYGLGADLADFRRELAAIARHDELLRLYSSLFVAPPRPVQINTGCYLDGALNGGSVSAMEAAYRSCGVERDAGFRDLPDHLALQLEFVALLYFRSAEAVGNGTALPGVRPEHFLHGVVSRWLPPFIADLERDAEQRGNAPNPYLPLARMLAAAVACDALPEDVPAAELRARKAIGKARHDRAERGVTGEDMEFIARKLREKGLSTDHLAIPPELRDEAQGYSRKQPPSPRRGSRYE